MALPRNNLTERWQRFADDASKWPVAELVAALMLLNILLWTEITWVIVAVVKVVAVVGLLSRRLRTDPRLWVVMTGLLAAALYWEWHPHDNHQFLIVYMSLLLFCVFAVDDEYPEVDRDAVLAMGARWLVGAVMLLAVIWKLVTPEYVSGEFFQHALMRHVTLHQLAESVGLISAQMVAENQGAAQWLHFSYLSESPVDSVPLEGTPAVATAAVVLTWWTVGIEATIAATIAALWLWPRRWGGDHRAVFHARHLALMLFLVTTYPFAPVVGFAWSLAILGMASCARGPTLWRPVYVVAILALLLVGYVAGG